MSDSENDSNNNSDSEGEPDHQQIAQQAINGAQNEDNPQYNEANQLPRVQVNEEIREENVNLDVGLQQVIDEDGESVKGRFISFIEGFELRRRVADGGDDISGIDGEVNTTETIYTYREQIQKLINNPNPNATVKNTLYLNLQHIKSYDYELSEAIENDYYRFERYLEEGVRQIVFTLFPEIKARVLASQGGGASGEGEYSVSVYNASEILAVRGVRMERIGKVSLDFVWLVILLLSSFVFYSFFLCLF